MASKDSEKNNGVWIDRQGNVILRPCEGNKEAYRTGYDQIDWGKSEAKTIEPTADRCGAEDTSGPAAS